MSSVLNKLKDKKTESNVRWCVLNHPYEFRMKDGSKLIPDSFGIYHPKDEEEIAQLEHFHSKGFVCKESAE